MGVQHERGRMERKDVERALAPHLGDLTACFADAVGTRRWLGGTVSIRWDLEADGSLVQVALAESDLGNREIERCLLEVASRPTFPPPKGNAAADFSIPIEFPAGREPMWWDEEVGDAMVRRLVPQLDACAAESDGVVPEQALVTAYVTAPGKVESVGFATTGLTGLPALWADCAERTVLTWRLSDPGKKVGKLMFRYPAVTP